LGQLAERTEAGEQMHSGRCAKKSGKWRVSGSNCLKCLGARGGGKAVRCAGKRRYKGIWKRTEISEELELGGKDCWSRNLCGVTVMDMTAWGRLNRGRQPW